MHDENTKQQSGYNNCLSLFGLFLLTGGLLAFEVTFTRLYSFLFTSNYVYIIVSAGIAGIGLGALLFSKIEKYLSKPLSIALAFFPVAAVLLLFVFSGYFANIYFYLTLTFLIFLDIGIHVVLVYRRSALHPALIYSVDLAGAAIGSLGGYLSVQTAGAPRAIQVIALCIIAGAFLVSLSFIGFKKLQAILFFCGLLIAFASVFLKLDEFVRLPPESEKEMAGMAKSLPESRIERSSWSAFGRVDVMSLPDDYGKVLFIDGSAGTTMLRFDSKMKFQEKLDNVIRSNTSVYLSAGSLFADTGVKDRKSLVIGSGGGIDVVTLLGLGFENITAVEINPDFIDTVKEYKDFNGGIYSNHPNITVVQNEGRHFVRGASREYDVLLISLPLIKSIRNYASYAMSENYLFTKDAFTEYRSLLAPGGYFFIVAHGNIEVFRLLMNALDSFAKDGIGEKDAMKRIAILELGHRPVVIIKNTEFSKKESENLHGILHLLPQHTPKSISFIPNLESQAISKSGPFQELIMESYMHNTMIYRLYKSEITAEELREKAPENISSISDDSPFFYSFEKGIPQEILIVFVLSGITLIAIFIRNRKKERASPFFAIVGLGFMMIEIVYLQRFGFFWGQETFSLALLLGIILVATGLGSLFSRIIKNTRKSLLIAAFAVPSLAVFFAIAGNSILGSFQSQSLAVKIAVTALFAVPQFFVMGFVFPSLLREVMPGSKPAMLALNGLASLAGSALALALAISFGFTYAIAAGGLLYALLFAYRPESVA